ncbi:MAG TPA: hypothetical protein VJX67_02335 [Blastocatellia bacterium]|nr:hypothetical protein [Blastocatellia bacterium]
MSNFRQSPGPSASLEGATRLQRDLMAFVRSGEIGNQYLGPYKLLFESPDLHPERCEALASSAVLDWFVFDWLDAKGTGVIDRFMSSRPSLTSAYNEILTDWKEMSVASIFEVRGSSDGKTLLTQPNDGNTYRVSLSMEPGGTGLKPGQFLAARILPVDDRYILSVNQVLGLNRDDALDALKLNRTLKSLNTPEGIEKLRAEQRAQFIAFFGEDRPSFLRGDCEREFDRFRQHLAATAAASGDATMKARLFVSELAIALKVPQTSAIGAGSADIQISAICDEFEGIVLLPRYLEFRRIFESENPAQALEGWKDLAWAYIKDPEIPIVAFEEIAERYPDRVEHVIRSLHGNQDFSIDHLYAMLLHYKEPTEGFDDLKDDERLWDLLDHGSTSTTQSPRRESSRPSAPALPGALNPRVPSQPEPGRKQKETSKPVTVKSTPAAPGKVRATDRTAPKTADAIAPARPQPASKSKKD